MHISGSASRPFYTQYGWSFRALKCHARWSSANERFKASVTPLLQLPVMLEGQVSREEISAVEGKKVGEIVVVLCAHR